MKIYIWWDGLEKGPYDRTEIFALLKEGAVSMETFARLEADREYRSLSSVLASGSNTLFSADQIVQKQSELPPVQNFTPPVFLSGPPLEPQPEGTPSHKRAWVLVGCGMVVALVSWWILFSPRPDPEAGIANEGAVETEARGNVAAVVETSNPPLEQLDPLAPLAVTQPEISELIDSVDPDGEEIAATKIVSDAQQGSIPEDVVSEETGKLADHGEEEASDSPVPTLAPRQMPQEDRKASPTIVEQIPVTTAARPMSRDRNEIKEFAAFDPFEMPVVNVEELVAVLSERFSYKPVQARQPNRTRNLRFETGSVFVDTPLKWNPKVEVIYRIPRRPNGSPGPDADNLVMWSDWPPGMHPFITRKVDGKDKEVKRGQASELNYFGDVCGFTTFQLLIRSPKEALSDPGECYYKGGAEWVKIVFKAKEALEKHLKLKERKLLLLGHSIGATFVQRIAAAEPSKVGAVAVQAAPEITVPTETSDAAWLLSVNRGDTTRESIKQLRDGLSAVKSNYVLGIFPPPYGIRANRAYYHQQSEVMRIASRTFIKGVVDRKGNGDAIRSETWPFVRDRRKPLKIERAMSSVIAKIPEEHREFLPSIEFVECLQKAPAPMHRLRLSKAGQSDLECFVGLPPLGKPKGVILYLHNPDIHEIPIQFDNINYLADCGFLVIAPRCKAIEGSTLEIALEFLKQSGLERTLKTSYLCVGEMGNGVWSLIASKSLPQPETIALMEFEPKDSLNEIARPAGGGVRAPTLFIYDEKIVSKISTLEDVRSQLANIRATKEYMKKCDENHQFVRVAVVSAEARNKADTANRSIRWAADFITKIVEQRRNEIVLPSGVDELSVSVTP